MVGQKERVGQEEGSRMESEKDEKEKERMGGRGGKANKKDVKLRRRK